jgi:putative endonuclease
MSQKIGFIAEKYACDYLQKQGLKLITSNYRCRVGEIDLIMQDNEFLVFIEVRARTSATHGNALESVNYFKQQKLIKAATYYLLQQKCMDLPMRFDIFALDGIKPTVNWVKNAFSI